MSTLLADLRQRASLYSARALLSLPRPLLSALAGSPPASAAGLDPEAWMLARLADRVDVPISEVPLERLRHEFEVEVGPFSLRAALPVTVEDGSAGGVPSRLYIPAEASAPGPLLIYFHGGGWARGSLTTHDPCCRLLAHHSGVPILSVDYRLAPEHPFPAGPDDALAAYAEVASNPGDFGADPARLALGGDSAGGNLAAVTAQSVRNRGLRPAAFQLLIYPVIDLAAKTESYRAFSTGFSLTERNMDWYADRYVPDPARREDPRVSPLRAASLAGLPTAHVATALADPLRDEGEAYARRLAEAGVRVALHRHPLLHGFVNMGGTRAARQAIALTAGALRQGVA